MVVHLHPRHIDQVLLTGRASHRPQALLGQHPILLLVALLIHHGRYILDLSIHCRNLLVELFFSIELRSHTLEQLRDLLEEPGLQLFKLGFQRSLAQLHRHAL